MTMLRQLMVIAGLGVLLVGAAPTVEAGEALETSRAGSAQPGPAVRAQHMTPAPSPRQDALPSRAKAVLARPPSDEEMYTFFPGDPVTVHIVVPAPAASPPVATAPAEVGVPPAKFVFPPSARVEPAPGPDAVIVQHGSTIEVIKVPIDR